MNAVPDNHDHDLEQAFEELTGLDTDASPAQSKRAHRRFRWRGRMEVAWLTDAGFEEARIVDSLDLGLGGMGLVSPDKRCIGDVGAALVLDSGEAGALRFFEVAHCRKDPDMGSYLVGARWTTCPDASDSICVKNTARGLRLCVRSASSTTDDQAASREVA